MLGRKGAVAILRMARAAFPRDTDMKHVVECEPLDGPPAALVHLEVDVTAIGG